MCWKSLVFISSRFKRARFVLNKSGGVRGGAAPPTCRPSKMNFVFLTFTIPRAISCCFLKGFLKPQRSCVFLSVGEYVSFMSNFIFLVFNPLKRFRVTLFPFFLRPKRGFIHSQLIRRAYFFGSFFFDFPWFFPGKTAVSLRFGRIWRDFPWFFLRKKHVFLLYLVFPRENSSFLTFWTDLA